MNDNTPCLSNMEKNERQHSGQGLPAPVCWAGSDLETLPILSIRQPWAWAIINVGKDIENRTWKTNYRGRFLIHAAKGCTQAEYYDAKDFCLYALDQKFRGKGIVFPAWQNSVRGGIVGVAEIVDCVDRHDSQWFFGPYGFVIRNAQPVEFRPLKGALGFFHLPNGGGEASP